MHVKPLILLLLLVATTVQVVLAQPSTSETYPGAIPGITWLPRQLDVGLVPFGVPVTREFIVENKSDSTLLLTHVRTNCHCTTAIWTPDPIAPGSRGTVSVTFDALKEGEFYKVLIVFTNQDKEQPIGLIFKGNVDKKPAETDH